MSAAREPCPNCQLPYYTDRNSDCPYCGALAGDDESAAGASASADSSPTVDTPPAGSVAGPTPPSRPRTVCSNCGLAHYADDDNGCPYCTMAGRAPDTAAPEAEAEGVDTNTEAEAEGSAAQTAEPAATTATPEGTDTADDQSSGGLLSRLRNLFS
ncbi:hypothetical protein [Haloglomus halophilum]|uniref:hypothetical protein n=1 Tax=Haloglomus halophilum TaxID=2962672 RepID=UPI0020C9CF29|nr:hypothetical protein [Haloglomus halophilum]